MSDNLISEISVNIGEVPNSPGLKVAFRLAIGPENSASIKDTFTQKTGAPLEDLSLYVVIKTKSEDSAKVIHGIFQGALDKFHAGEVSEDLPPQITSLIARSEDEEFEGQPKFVFAVTVSGEHVVIKGKLITQAREIAASSYETAAGLAGEILSKNSEVYFEFDAAKALEEVLHSQNAIQDFFEALSLKLWIHLHPQLFGEAATLVSNLGAPETIATGLGTLGLFSSATLSLNFKSASELPEDIKASIAKLSSKNNFKEIHAETPQKLKNIFALFGEHGTGNVFLFAGIQTNAVQVELHVPGLSKFLSE
jgi:hypothetical protein